MPIKDDEIKKVISYVKKEPRTVQDISKLLGKAWLTADSYVAQIKQKTGLIQVKTFRAGSQGALKIVFYSDPDSINQDEIKETLFNKIKHAKTKKEFDFLDVFQFISDKTKRSFSESYISDEDFTKEDLEGIKYFKRAEKSIFLFSGNLSFLNYKNAVSAIEDALKKKVEIKILCRINAASLLNLSKIDPLLKKYAGQIEIRHCYQPLRGMIVDGKLGRFKQEEKIENYKKGELPKNLRIFYEFFDPDWLNWFEKVFWNLFRSSIDYNLRIKELKKIF